MGEYMSMSKHGVFRRPSGGEEFALGYSGGEDR